MRAEFLEPAQAELEEAAAFYESQRIGLAAKFKEEVKRSIERILQYPNAWPSISPRTRRCLTNKFPYGIIYQFRDDVVLVIAVMHLHREPKTWKSRI